MRSTEPGQNKFTDIRLAFIECTTRATYPSTDPSYISCAIYNHKRTSSRLHAQMFVFRLIATTAVLSKKRMKSILPNDC